MLSGADSAFAGGVVIIGGTVELATSGGVGNSTIAFASTATSATLQIDAADTPAPGGTFASTLSNFNQSFDGLDLRGVTFVSGATAVVSGSTLVVSDGGHTYDFTLGGSLGSTYVVTSDGAGGTLINDPHAPGGEAAFSQAFSLLNGVATNFAESNGVLAVSSGAGHLDLAGAHHPHA